MKKNTSADYVGQRSPTQEYENSPKLPSKYLKTNIKTCQASLSRVGNDRCTEFTVEVPVPNSCKWLLSEVSLCSHRLNFHAENNCCDSSPY